MVVRKDTLRLSIHLHNSAAALIENDARMDKKIFTRAKAEGASEILNVLKRKLL